MTINNNLKKDFLEHAFIKFFPNVFSLIEIRDTYDFLKISDQTLDQLWLLFKKRYPEEVQDIEAHLQRFRPDAQNSEDLFKYSLAHLFGLGDINFDWEPHNPHGYCSIGEQHELIFNEVREMAQALIEEVSELLFGKEVHFFNNMKIVIITDEKSPPPYNGAHKSKHGKQELDEVTYENKYSLTYYDERPRLKPYMDYIYSLVGKEAYESFWTNYSTRYFDLKNRYYEAYQNA